jgi:hypothetical protein
MYRQAMGCVCDLEARARVLGGFNKYFMYITFDANGTRPFPSPNKQKINTTSNPTLELAAYPMAIEATLNKYLTTELG